MSPLRRIALFLLWAAVLSLAAGWLTRELKLSADLQAFLPAAETDDQRLLRDELGEGPGSRLLMLAIRGADAVTRAEASAALRARLKDDARVVFVANGELDADQLPQDAFSARYLLIDSPLDARTLGSALLERELDLASPLGELVERVLAEDPTLAIVDLLDTWRPAREPAVAEGVWASPSGDAALALVQTRASGFDPQAQGELIAFLQQTVRDHAKGLSLEVSGPGAFSARIASATREEATRISLLASVGVILLLLFAYRRLDWVLAGALPLASAGLAGAFAVMLVWGSMHGITFAFGVTLIGVAQDYPTHLFSHLRAPVPARLTVRSLWPTLRLGVLSTCIAYLALFGAGVEGLGQLALFTIVGLAVAGLSTRYLLPGLIGPLPAVPARAGMLALRRALDRLPRPWWLLLALLGAGIAFLSTGSDRLWQNDLSRLSPLPRDAIERDIALREALAAPDVRQLISIRGEQVEDVLLRSEALMPKLDALQSSGVLAGYDLAARYLPSQQRQRARQAALPDGETLRAALSEAAADSAFAPELFEPFLTAVEAARSREPLQLDTLEPGMLQDRAGSLLRKGDQGWTGLITLTGLTDVAALDRALAGSAEGVSRVDLKAASEGLVSAYRAHVVNSLGIAALLLLVMIAIGMRSTGAALRVSMPVLVSAVLATSCLHLAGVELSLFHLIALMLGAGLGLDYALFFARPPTDAREAGDTLHALIVCAVSTLLVFGLLAASALPLLAAIGQTVSLSVLLNLLLGAIFARHRMDRP